MDLQTYLKKYSSISTSFIDDFFGLYNSTTTAEDFVIDLDKISKWLKSQKFTLKDTLIKSYKLDIDYKVTKNETKMGRPSETILLTPECFKRLSLLSRTEKAEEVRTYFIQIEKHLDKYKNYIINGLNQKVAKYEVELKPQSAPTNKGAIYVLKTTEDIEGVYKIGRTKNFAERLKVHQSSHPDKLEIMHVYETDNIEAVENCLKLILKTKAYRKRREFYEIDIDLLKELIKSCDCMNLAVRRNSKTIKSKECNYVIHITKHY
jgi:phage anti-repressor protein/predicted GIY-YIG superfamily endonuclease